MIHTPICDWFPTCQRFAHTRIVVNDVNGLIKYNIE